MTQNARPWSAREIEEQVPVVIDRLNEATAQLLVMGTDAAQAEWRYRRGKAMAYVKVQGKNAEEREARALLSQAEPGVTVADLGEQRDLAENAYKSQRAVIASLDTEARLMQTLIVSGRAGS